MRAEPHHFFSDGLTLSGTFYRPDEEAGQVDAGVLIVACAGFTGMQDLLPKKFAQYLTAHGHTVFSFDYRGFGRSEGERGRVILDEQVRDIRHAVTFAQQTESAPAVVLLGWAMAAGMVIDASRELDELRGVVALNGFYSGLRFEEEHRSPEQLAEFREVVRADRVSRVLRNQPKSADPFAIYPMDEISTSYVEETLEPIEEYASHPFLLEMGESLLRWLPEAYAPYCRLPILVGHSQGNELHSPEGAKQFFEHYGGPKSFVWIGNVGHTEWVEVGNPFLESLCADIADWIATHDRRG